MFIRLFFIFALSDQVLYRILRSNIQQKSQNGLNIWRPSLVSGVKKNNDGKKTTQTAIPSCYASEQGDNMIFRTNSLAEVDYIDRRDEKKSNFILINNRT